MRDLLLVMIMAGALPFAFRHAWVGVLLWTWISIMNPHRLTYGFAYGLPWAQIVAAVTFVALFTDKERLKFPWTAPVIALILFLVWTCITTIFAVYFAPSLEQLEKVLKIQLFTLIAFAAIRERKHIEYFIWINVISIAFYGVKGGIFVIRSGGGERVWGPAGSFIEGNNEVGLAIIMVIPLMYYLMSVSRQKWVRWALIGSMALCAAAAIGTYSRGALLAIAAMGALMWWRSNGRIVSGILIVAAGAVIVNFMPQQWEDRMGTIKTYEQDQSAQGRLNAWEMAFNLANDRVLGAGFETTSDELFRKYAPIPYARAAHSIYFQVLGEHGWIGLALFLAIGAYGFIVAARVRRLAKAVPDGQWLSGLAGMIQVSMVGFAVGGAFLSLAYFDLPYNILVMLVACDRWIAEERWKTEKTGAFGSATPQARLAAPATPPAPASSLIRPRTPPRPPRGTKGSARGG
jgi:putative inorganic carbon (hco3(-)) transporter